MALPICAGLKILAPSPPKTCLPIIMAHAAPKVASPGASCGGRQKASSSPVNSALPSLMVTGRRIAFWHSASASTAAAQLAAITLSASVPK